MQLSQKQKALFQFLVACPKLRLNFELFKNKDDLHSLRTFELPDDDDWLGSGWLCHPTKWDATRIPNFIGLKALNKQKMR